MSRSKTDKGRNIVVPRYSLDVNRNTLLKEVTVEDFVICPAATQTSKTFSPYTIAQTREAKL